jgi:hypothetical protein
MKRFLISLWMIIFCVVISAADFPEVGPGMTYICERSGDTPWAVFVVKIDRSRTDLSLVTLLSNEKVLGLETVPEMVKKLPAEMGKPVAAINGDWFELPAGPYQGDLLNIFIHRGELISLGSWGDTFWIDAKNQPRLEKVVVDLSAAWGDSTKTTLALNGPRKDDGAALYTPILGPSTHTKDGRELILEKVDDNDWLPLRAGKTITAKVKEIRAAGDTEIPKNGMILSLGPKMKVMPAAVGDKIVITAASTPDLTGVEYAMGGGPILIKDGKLPTYGKGEQPRHPRSMIGWNDTHLFLIAIDGRRGNWSAGMTNAEQGEMAKRLGCTNALNLDGGGSTTLWLNDQVMNMPSGGALRPVGNGFAVVRKTVTEPEKKQE